MQSSPKYHGPNGPTSPYELVLCDVELPGIPGVEVLNQLRGTLRNEVSIIMLASDMTGSGAEMVERCIVEGADSYILKPAALKELTALWGFVARRRQHNVEQSSQMADLNQASADHSHRAAPAPATVPATAATCTCRHGRVAAWSLSW